MPDLPSRPLADRAELPTARLKHAIPRRNLILKLPRAPQTPEIEPLRPVPHPALSLDLPQVALSAGLPNSPSRPSSRRPCHSSRANLVRVEDDGLGGEVAVVRVVETVVDKVAREHLYPPRRSCPR